MTLRVLYLVVLLFVGGLAALSKVAVAPGDDVRTACKRVKQPVAYERELCEQYGHPLK
jgi:hypothetical protein